MKQLTVAGDGLRRADGLPVVLDAACGAFEDILALSAAAHSREHRRVAREETAVA